MCLLQGRGYDERPDARQSSNARAMVESALATMGLALIALLLATTAAVAQETAAPAGKQQNTSQQENGIGKALRFVAGAGTGLATHEAGHLVFDFLFDADPRVKAVDFHGIPFFAVTHRGDLSPRREFLISSAGFTVQHLENEWLLARKPHLRDKRSPVLKGMFTFNVVTSAAYAGAAFARTGPYERDTRGIASSSRVDERIIGVMVLAPAVLDAWRYFHPDSKWAAWTSRGAKAGLFLLVIR
jgi:hypothetical protein